VPLAITAFLEYQHISKMLLQRSFDQLTSVREIKRQRIESFFERKCKEVSFFAQSRTVIEAMQEFKAAFAAMRKAKISPQ